MPNQIPEQTVIATDASGSKVYREVVAVVNLDGSAVSGSATANNLIITNTFYKVLKAWATFTVNGTATYRSTTNTLTNVTVTGWYDGGDVLQADPPDTSYYTTLTDASTFAHTHLVDANGVMFYYVSRPNVASVAYKVSDGSIYSPVGAIKQAPLASSGIQPVPLQGNASHIYTLPVAPSSLTGAYILRNGVSYPVNGVDWTVAGTTLTIVNAQAKPALNEIFFFNWFA